MTVIAIVATRNVRRILADCDHVIVTGAARTNYLRMVDRKYRREQIGVVAVFAHIARLNMCRILADGRGTVMAAKTVARDIDVIEIRRQPGDCRMTIIASIGSRNMRWMFTGRDHAVMTGAARTQHLGMIHGSHWRPHIEVMAVFTNIGRLYMCEILTGR